MTFSLELFFLCLVCSSHYEDGYNKVVRVHSRFYNEITNEIFLSQIFSKPQNPGKKLSMEQKAKNNVMIV